MINYGGTYVGGHPAYPNQQNSVSTTLFSQQHLIEQYAGDKQMGFSKKHFEAFARHIAGLRDEGKHEHAEAIRDMVLKLNDNPRFDVGSFDKASKRPQQ